MNRSVMAIFVLVMATLACSSGERKPIVLYPTPTSDATQTPVVVKVKETAVVVWTTTPVPTKPSPTATRQAVLCISATEAVYLRPSPSTDNYPIMELKNGTEIVDLGGRSGDWLFASLGDKQGWINRKYVQECQ